MLSVVIPVFNVEPYVEQSVKSVLSQTFKDLEVVCIDDGSTDESLSILNALAASDPRVKVVSQPNRGVGATRNVGIELAEGEYIHFLDADDTLAPSAYEELLRNARNDNLDVLTFQIQPVYHSENLAERFPGFESYYRRNAEYNGIVPGRQRMVELVRNRDWLDPAGIHIIRRGLLVESHLRFQEGVKFEDCVFTLRLFLAAGRVSFEPGVRYQRLVRGGSIMTTPKTYREALDRLINAAQMLAQSQTENLTEDEAQSVARIVVNWIRDAEKIFSRLEKNEQRGVHAASSEVDVLVLVSQIQHISELKRKIKALRQAQSDLRNSRTYRLGRILTAPVRWLVRFLRR